MRKKQTKIINIFSQDYLIAIILFLLAFGVRTIPEIKAGIWPIGYDTFNTYLAEISMYQGSLIHWLKTANLVYFLFLPFKLLGINSSFIIKFFGPLLFGLLTASFYYWARFFVGLKPLKSFLATLIVIFQLATLRLSWDLYRNELALIFLFLAYINLHSLKKTKNVAFLTILSVLIALSNELVTVILLVTLAIFFFFLLKKKKFKDLPKVALPFALASIVFLVIISSSKEVLYNTHVIFTSENNYLVWRYFWQYQKDMSFAELSQTITGIFWLYYRYLLGFALLGFWLLRKNVILSVLTMWLVVGTFSALALGGTGIIVWDRWMVMLAFPFAIYAVEGVFYIGGLFATKPFKKLKFITYPTMVVFWLVFLGVLAWQVWPFLTRTYHDAKPPLANDQINEYFPRTMVHNAVGITKIENSLDCVAWLDKNVPSGSAVIVDNRWRGLMLQNFEMDNRYVITNAWSEQWPRKTFEFAVEKGFTKVYLIWNTSRDIRYFDRVFSSGNVAVYESKPPEDW